MSELNDVATAPRRRSGCFTFVFLTFLALLIIGGIVAWKLVDTGFGFKWLAEHFQQQTISEAFQENVKRIASTNGDVLELATLDMEEAITRFDTKTLFDTIYLGTTESEIRAMVVYRYHLKLSGDWKLTVENGRCVVIAPPIRPSLPPAIRTDTVERKSEAGWMRFNAAQNLVDLEKGMTSVLERRASAPSKIRHIREAARTSVAQFVQQWILKEQKDRPDSEIQDLVVIFPDEAAAKDPAEARKQPATLRVDANH
ncbi:MAG TPA: hypothetical protein VGE39_19275 [Prosthecobacter sp.]